MPQQTDSATRVALRSIDTHLIGRKVRVAGKVLSYDIASGLLVLLDSSAHALVVDARMAIDDEASAWARERLSKIVVIGLIERSDETIKWPFIILVRVHLRLQERYSTEIPTLPPNAPAQLALNRALVLRAILIIPAPDLDLALWKEVVDAEADHEDDDE
ncbi:hypothetical protein D9619_001928 [Psilocybe cf. subviscida]|uniref:OB domain-containing protein n=1 Tax=Psilocybe cf. subviscida TaxID=2480587 RepID=A0A8H5BHE2_9AGAR|nr:hypothetical protein D9619_001928 [Psilocybe cf. subviscida]